MKVSKIMSVVEMQNTEILVLCIARKHSTVDQLKVNGISLIKMAKIMALLPDA